MSFWARLDGGDGNVFSLLQSANFAVSVSRGSVGWIEFVCANSGGGTILNMRTSNTYAASAAWRHILASWDLAAGVTHLYVSDVSDKVTNTVTNDTIDYTATNWYLGAESTGNNKLDGCLAEYYFAPGQYLDFSAEANRRKFISAAGKPVYLGYDGSLPTGVAPLVYSRLYGADAAANFARNRGTGGNFTITGTLDIASSSPSS
jgi:hypothetical protein